MLTLLAALCGATAVAAQTLPFGTQTIPPQSTCTAAAAAPVTMTNNGAKIDYDSATHTGAAAIGSTCGAAFHSDAFACIALPTGVNTLGM
jgi:hypothetical protein